MRISDWSSDVCSSDLLPFDPLRDFTPISMLANVPSVLVARKDFPAQTMPEFVSLVKANPGKYTMALAAIGSSVHMAGERMKMMAGLDILNVPYKRSEEHTSELQSLMRISYAVFCLKKK